MESPGRLPSLPALRAFEAAARLGSVARAAAELFVTPGAVSHQISGLETQLGYALFVRQGRGIALTPEGRRLAATVNRLLMGVGQELDAIRRERERPRLVVTVLPSFSARWLTPRLGRFIEDHPDIELWVQTSKQIESLAESGMDLAIRIGPGQWRGLHAQPFLHEYFLVVASPRLSGGLPGTPDALAGKPLLRAIDEPWQPWFASVGLDWQEPDHGLVFSDSGMLVQAAVEGQGIALARRSLVQDELASGKLVQVFSQTLAHPWAYYLVTTQAPPHRPVLQTLIDWLNAEARLSFGDDFSA
ncbi:transcriptional regulator GcvA [Chitinimonas sp. BJYL2]|uniref:transcriptional regulator GcvA n=1 Tax=Chitinimonas sp. BJYL2 TaxID=2976696 RepID=UPI0022B49136|nr:transcriptional regulator GcvA [Chitinimonas sp. BJYL2]